MVMPSTTKLLMHFFGMLSTINLLMDLFPTEKSLSNIRLY